jgi:hypothetical protein
MDDVALYTTGKNSLLNVKLLKEAASTAFQWASENSVQFDDNKSELIHFTKQRTPKIATIILQIKLKLLQLIQLNSLISGLIKN